MNNAFNVFSISLKENKIFDNFLNKYDVGFKNVIVYWDIMFPLIFSFEYEDKIFLAYVIKCDDLEDELNIITTFVPNYEVLKELVESKNSIFDIFDREYEENCFFYNQKGKDIFYDLVNLGDSCDKIPYLTDFHYGDYLIEDLLPEDDFYLTGTMINKVNTHNTSKYLDIIIEQNNKILTQFNHSPIIKPYNGVYIKSKNASKEIMSSFTKDFEKYNSDSPITLGTLRNTKIITEKTKKRRFYDFFYENNFIKYNYKKDVE